MPAWMLAERQPPADLIQPCEWPEDIPPRAQMKADGEFIALSIRNGVRGATCAIRHASLVKWLLKKE